MWLVSGRIFDVTRSYTAAFELLVEINLLGSLAAFAYAPIPPRAHASFPPPVLPREPIILGSLGRHLNQKCRGLVFYTPTTIPIDRPLRPPV